MKTTRYTLLAFVFISFSIYAQDISTLNSAATTLLEAHREAHAKTWTKVESFTNGLGETVLTRTNVAYLELATGLHYWEDGAWKESKEEIEPFPGGASAVKGQHKVYFPHDIYSGVIELITPDGQHLKSRPLGLSYFDGTNSVLIAELTNSVGQISGNQVIYTNAFTDFECDIVCTYRLGGFESDVVLRKQPPAPGSFGLNPATTRIQLLTEFFDTPEPVQILSSVCAKDGLADTRLCFGQMQMAFGKAFMVGETSPKVPVYKTWTQLEGRVILIEELPFQNIEAQLETLPFAFNGTETKAYASLIPRSSRVLPDVRPIGSSTNRIQIAMADFSQRSGLVIDYEALNASETHYVFKGNETYYIRGPVYLFGTNNVIEGGAVIKYTNGFNPGCITVSGDVIFRTDRYRPAIFTAKDDNSVGETINGSTGAPSGAYGDMLRFGSGVDPRLEYARFCYANKAISFAGGATNTVRHVQIVDSSYGFYSESSSRLKCGNILFDGVSVPFGGYLWDGDAEHITVSGASALAADDGLGSGTLTLSNSILANVSSLIYNEEISAVEGSHNAFYNAPVFGSSSMTNTFWPFQSVGAGNFYLVTNRNCGTTNIHAALLAELQKKTTYPPFVYVSETISTNLVLSPQAIRDADVPDLGYHYDPIDYAMANVSMNNTMVVKPGTAIAAFETNFVGVISLGSAGSLISEGTVAGPVRIFEYAAVQEQPETNQWRRALGAPWLNVNSTSTVLHCSFTELSVLASGDQLIGVGNAQFISLRDCQFRGGMIYLEYGVAFTNCLFDRVTTYITARNGGVSVLRNNLFRGGELVHEPVVTNSVVKDNLFDSLHVSDLTGSYDASHNAYVTNFSTFPTGLGDRTLTNSPAYETGPLGQFYYPANFGLVNAGSLTADAVGLYHYTTSTNQAKEGNSTVDIGFHYAVLDAAGNPIDTDLDGIDDYVEDLNGNGEFNIGDLGNWQNLDPDYDGINDAQEVLDGTSPSDKNSALKVQLGSWRFDTTNWVGLQGQVPLSFTNLMKAAGLSSNAVRLSTNLPAKLAYFDCDPGFNIANINLRHGSLRFWFRPDWSGANTNGSGPLNEAPLIEIGSRGSNGWWGLMLNAPGTNLFFCTQTNAGILRTNLQATIQWRSNQWHQIVLTYSLTNSSLYVDGQLAVTNSGVTEWPGAAVRERGFRVGSSSTGAAQAKGRFENLETFNYVLSASDVTNGYTLPCWPALDTVLVTDVSGSMNDPMDGGTKLDAAKYGGSNFITRMNFSLDQAALVSFYSTTVLDQPLTNSGTAVISKLYSLSALSGTRIDRGITNAQAELTSVRHTLDALPVMVVLSDGAPSENSGSNTLDQATLAKNQGTRIISVALGSTGIDLDIMRGIASSTNDFYHATNTAQLTSVYDTIAQTLCRGTNQPPVVSITSPTNGQVFGKLAHVSINANASDPEGALVKVEFYAGTTKLGEDFYGTSGNYQFTWTNAPLGTNALTAVAWDEFGLSRTSSVVNVAVYSLLIVSPANGDTFLIPTNMLITATNIAPTGTTNVVQFFANGISLGFGFFTNGLHRLTWPAFEAGSYSLTAQLTNELGANLLSPPVSISIRGLPTVTITDPVEGQIFGPSPTNITVTATASPYGSTSITNVEFYFGTNKFGSDTTASYNAISNGVPSGVHWVRAKATDNTGVSRYSKSVRITVNTANQAPIVNPGPNQTNRLHTVDLPGSVWDDGLPAGSTLSVTWSKVSGGDMVFSNANLAATTAWFSSAGVYTLRLQASDGALSASNDVTITLIASNSAPNVEAGPDQTIHWPSLAGCANNHFIAFAPYLTNGPSDETYGIWSWDYYAPSNGFVVLANTNDVFGADRYRFEKVSTNGVATIHYEFALDESVANIWAVARDSRGGFSAGDIFFAKAPFYDNGWFTPIYRISPNGTLVGSPGNGDVWAIIPDHNAVQAIRVDDTGAWGGDLIVFAGNKLWRISSNAQVTRVTQTAVQNYPDGTFLNRLVIVPTDFEKYGPWSGRVLIVSVADPGNAIVSIDQNGFYARWEMPVLVTDLVFVEPNADGFNSTDGSPDIGTDDGRTLVWASVCQFANMSGDILVRAEGSTPFHRIRWNGFNFEVVRAGLQQFSGRLVFAPALVTTNSIQRFARLQGWVGDDSMVSNTPSVRWLRVDGPGPVFFDDPTKTNTTARFVDPGTYLLRLTAHDGEKEWQDDVTIKIGPDQDQGLVSLSPLYSVVASNAQCTLTVTVVQTNGLPAANISVTNVVAGKNPATNSALTDTQGKVQFNYTGTGQGRDTVQSSATVNGITAFSAQAIIDWSYPMQCGVLNTGEVTSADGVDPTLSPGEIRYFHVFSFTNAIDEQAGFTYENIWATTLVLRDATNKVLAVGEAGSLFHWLPYTGTYVVQATSTSSSNNHPYQVTLLCGTNALNHFNSLRPRMAALFNGTNLPNGSTLVFGPTLTNLAVTNVITLTNLGPTNIVFRPSHVGSYLRVSGDFEASFHPSTPTVQEGSATYYYLPAYGSATLEIRFLASSNQVSTNGLVLHSDAGVDSQNPQAFVLDLAGSAFPPGGPPDIQITSPNNHRVYIAPANVSITATNTGTNALSKVVFQAATPIGTVEIGSDATVPYSVVWSNAPAGDHALTATGIDTNGRSSTSLPVTIHLLSPTTNKAPVATNDFFTVLTSSANNVLLPLANDWDQNGDSLVVNALTTPGFGTNGIIDNGKAVKFTPQFFTRGSDGFSYEISDGRGGTDWGQVFIRVFATDQPDPRIISPPNNHTTNGGATVQIVAQITNTPNVAKVEFYLGQTKLWETNSGIGGTNFFYDWTAVSNNCECGFIAVATDIFGQIGSSEPIHIRVNPPTTGSGPANQFDTYVGSSGTNPVITLVNDGDYLYATNLMTIRDGLLDLYGRAYHPQGSNITWRLGLYTLDGLLLRTITNSSTAVGTNTSSGLLAKCDLTTLRNGIYDLKLIVTGNSVETESIARFRLETNLKLGQFSFSQQDAVLPVNGIPLAVVRTYNSQNPERGDFGYGWTYSLIDLEVELNERREEVTDAFDPEESTFSMRRGGSWDVTLTLPDTGQRTTFFFNARQGSAGTYHGEWLAAPGVTAKLEPRVNTDLQGILSLGGAPAYWQAAGRAPLETFDVASFKLTTLDGTVYIIDREDLGYHYVDDGGLGYGVQAYGKPYLSRIEQRSGDWIEIDTSEIRHRDPQQQITRKITFERNSKGLITAIRDPISQLSTNNPQLVKYEYDSTDNLMNVLTLVDRSVARYVTNTFTYTNVSFPHYITGIIDPRGIKVAKTFYDDTGKIIGVEDANGKKTTFTHNINGRLEVVVDRLGNTNSYAYDQRGNVVATTNALGVVSRMGYDDLNRETAVTNAFGTSTATWMLYGYDANGQQTSMVDSLNRTNSFSYDAFGSLLSHTDPLGNVTTNAYDSAGNVTNTVTRNPQGQLVGQSSSTYTEGRLSAMRNANGQTTATFTYDPTGNLTNTADVNGFARSFNYDLNGNQTNTSFVWVGPVTNVVSTFTEFDAAGRVIRSIDPDGNTNRTFYTSGGKIDYAIDRFGNTNSFVYDARGNLIQTTHPDGLVTRTVYNDEGRPIVTADRNGITGTRTEYDALGRVTNTVRVLNVRVDLVDDTINYGQKRTVIGLSGTAISSNRTEYLPSGWVATRINPEGYKTTYDYWPDGQVKSVTDPLTNTSYFEYDNGGRRKLVSDALNRTNRFEYDAVGRLIKTIYPDSSSSSNQFNLLGQRVKEADQANRITQFAYDVSGQLTNVTKPLVPDPETGGTATPAWAYIYDQYGRQTAMIDPKGRGTTNSFNQFGREMAQRLPLGETNWIKYNGRGQVSEVWDFKKQRKTFVYDRFGRVATNYFFHTGATYPSNSIAYLYNQLGQLTEVIERSGTNASIGYIAAVGSPGGRTRYAALIAFVDRAQGGLGGALGVLLCGVALACVPREKRRQLALVLREALRAQAACLSGLRGAGVPFRKRSLPGRCWRFATVVTVIALLGCDPAFNQLWNAHAACGDIPANYSTPTTRITTYAYDLEGRLAQVNSPEGVINYEYDLATGRHVRTCTKNSEFTYQYDALGRLWKVNVLKRNGSTITTETTTYTYTKVGNRASVTLPSGTVTSYVYDNLDRLTGLTNRAADNSLLSAFNYQMDATGRRTNAVEILKQEDSGWQTNTLNWAYDAMYRLTNEVCLSSVSSASYTNRFQYDKAGNRWQHVRVADSGTTTITNLYNANDQLLTEVTLNGSGTPIATNTYAYDANGSLIAKTNLSASSAATLYGYDLKNKLNSVTAVGSGVTNYFLYNDSGIRVQKWSSAGGNPTLYLIDANNHTGYAQVLEELTTLGSAPTISYIIGDDVLGQAGSDASYLLYDGHGSTRQVASSIGGITSRYNYDAYGVSLGTSSASPQTSLRYCGEQFDEALQAYNLRARFYDPANGRFSQRDSFVGINSDPQSLHKYAFTSNDPFNNSDPTGLLGTADVTSSLAIGLVLFSLVVGGLYTAIQYGRGVRGWNLLWAFLMSSGITLGLLAGGLSSIVWISTLATVAGFLLFAYAVYHYGSKVVAGTFDRWDACEVLLFLVAWSVARGRFSADEPIPPKAGQEMVVLQHGTSSTRGNRIMDDRGFAPAELNEGAVFTTPTPENMPQGAIMSPHASKYASNRAQYEGGDPVIINLMIPKDLLPTLKMKDKPFGGDEFALDPTLLNTYIKQGKVGISMTSGVKNGNTPPSEELSE